MNLWRRTTLILGQSALCLALMSGPAQALDTHPTDGAASVTAEQLIQPSGWVPQGNWYKTEKSCEARAKYLMHNPPPNMVYTDYHCFQLPNGRWSLYMWSPEVGCVLPPTLSSATDEASPTRSEVPTCG